MLETVLEKLNKAKELIEEAKELASKHNIQLLREVWYLTNNDQKLARERPYWQSSTDQCNEDPDYMDYV